MQSFSFESMGTSFAVSIWDGIPDSVFLEFQKDIIAKATAFDQRYSRFIKTSLVWEIANKTGRVSVDADFVAMLQIYGQVYELSEKKFSPLIGFSISDMGYDETYTLTPKEIIRSTPDFLNTVRIINNTEIEILEPVLFDIGGVGKGYFVDKISQYLTEKGIRQFLVNGSGDLYYSGNGQPVSVGLEHPTDKTKVIGVAKLEKGSLAASGSSRRNWGKYHHIIDAVSLTSPTDIIATWVKTDSIIMADVLATCLFLCPAENFSKKYQFEYLVLTNAMQTKSSAGFSAELF